MPQPSTGRRASAPTPRAAGLQRPAARSRARLGPPVQASAVAWHPPIIRDAASWEAAEAQDADNTEAAEAQLDDLVAKLDSPHHASDDDIVAAYASTLREFRRCGNGLLRMPGQCCLDF